MFYSLFFVVMLLEWGTTALEPVLTWLQNVISEFIPYLVYLGLGIIVATIGFVAIKWLMNWTSAKVRGTFSSRRRR